MKADSMTAVEGVIYLVACALHKECPDDKILMQMNMGEVYKLANWHSLGALCYHGLEKKSEIMSESLCKKWAETLYRSACKNILLDMEREKFLTFCEEKGIRYMPLKGSVLQNDYPAPGTREMADNDILYDEAFEKEVKDFFLSEGYSEGDFTTCNHDAYFKIPIYNFELHKALFRDCPETNWDEYYRDIFSMIIPDEDKKFGYHFKEEDFYVYLIAHAYKHYNNGGTGLRSLVDWYVYNHNHKLDRQYVDEQLTRLEIKAYEQEAVGLAEKLFADSKRVQKVVRSLSEKERALFDFYIASGTYGTDKHRIDSRMLALSGDEKHVTKNTRIKYIWKRFFPGKEYMYQWSMGYFPFFAQHKWLLWVATPWRIIYKGTRGFKRLRREFRIVWASQDESPEKPE